MRQNKYEYDAFISHAVEDKIPIANELCAKLERAGLKIWYSGKELGVGDSIEKTIERGLNRSRYGIVIFSPTYLAKNWTIREFYTLLAKEIEEQKVILPVLYNITLDELKNKDLVMADRFAVNSEKGIDFVVERIVREIRKAPVIKKKEAWFSRMWLVLIISLLANVALLLKNTVSSSPLYPALPTVMEENRHGRTNQTIASSLLGEMQGLLTKFNGCSCTDPTRSDESASYQAAVQTHMTSPRTPKPAFAYHDASGENAASLRSSKITMAVVFQIEPARQAPAALEQDLDQMIETVSLEEEQGHFMTVAQGNPSRPQKGHECPHDSYLGD